MRMSACKYVVDDREGAGPAPISRAQSSLRLSSTASAPRRGNTVVAVVGLDVDQPSAGKAPPQVRCAVSTCHTVPVAVCLCGVAGHSRTVRVWSLDVRPRGQTIGSVGRQGHHAKGPRRHPIGRRRHGVRQGDQGRPRGCRGGRCRTRTWAVVGHRRASRRAPTTANSRPGYWPLGEPPATGHWDRW